MKMMKKLSLFLFILFTPFLALAEESEGLVPCKIGECEICHLFVLLNNVIDFFLFTIIPILVPFMIILGGVVLVVAYANPSKGAEYISKARNIFKTIIIGTVLVYSAWILVNVFFQVLGHVEWKDYENRWEIIDCD